MPFYFLPSSFVLSKASTTALIAAALNAASSSASTPAMVLPIGLQTASFSSPGCFPVSRTVCAEPRTVCAA